MQYTGNYNLKKPEGTDTVNIDDLNYNTGIIDTQLKASQDAVDAVQTNLNTHLADFVRQPGYALATGSANAYVITLSPVPTSYVEGMAIAVRINVDNTGPSSINVNSLGAKSIKKPNGNNVLAGNLKTGSVYTMRYNGTNFILQGEGGGGTAQPGEVLAGETFTNDSGEQTGTMPNRTGHVNAQSISRNGSTLRFRPQQGYYGGESDNSVQYADSNFIASNIKKDVSLFGLTGTLDSVGIIDLNIYTTGGYSGNLQANMDYFCYVSNIDGFPNAYAIYVLKKGSSSLILRDDTGHGNIFYWDGNQIQFGITQSVIAQYLIFHLIS